MNLTKYPENRRLTKSQIRNRIFLGITTLGVTIGLSSLITNFQSSSQKIARKSSSYATKNNSLFLGESYGLKISYYGERDKNCWPGDYLYGFGECQEEESENDRLKERVEWLEKEVSRLRSDHDTHTKILKGHSKQLEEHSRRLKKLEDDIEKIISSFDEDDEDSKSRIEELEGYEEELSTESRGSSRQSFILRRQTGMMKRQEEDIQNNQKAIKKIWEYTRSKDRQRRQ